ALCGLGVILLDGLAGRCDAALMERREDRARADGVHTNALRRVVGGQRPRQPRDRSLGGVVLQVAAACDDGTHGGDVNDGAALVANTPDRRLAEPRCPARHRCNLAVEPSHVRHPSLHYETRIHDTSYPSGGHRLVGPAWVPDLNRLRKLRGSAFETLRWADSLRLGSTLRPMSCSR